MKTHITFWILITYNLYIVRFGDFIKTNWYFYWWTAFCLYWVSLHFDLMSFGHFILWKNHLASPFYTHTHRSVCVYKMCVCMYKRNWTHLCYQSCMIYWTLKQRNTVIQLWPLVRGQHQPHSPVSLSNKSININIIFSLCSMSVHLCHLILLFSFLFHPLPDH